MAGEVLSKEEFEEFKGDLDADVEVGCVRSNFDTDRLAGAVGYLLQRAEAAERDRDVLIGLAG